MQSNPMSTKRKLIVISGGDRVGKSTVADAIQSLLGEENCSLYHHGAPPFMPDRIFDFYQINAEEWLRTEKEWCVFDRSWVCSYALETFRRQNNGHLDDIVSTEIDFLKMGIQVAHVIFHRPWSWAAPHHIEEIETLNPSAPRWKVVDEYVFRQNEHKHYYERMRDFTENFTMFPSHWHSADSWSTPQHDASSIIGNVKGILSWRGLGG